MPGLAAPMKSGSLRAAAAQHHRPCGCLRGPRPFASAPIRRAPAVCRAQQQDQEVDIDSAVEAFMKRQAEIESGAAFARTVEKDRIIGGDVVSDEAARTYCREVFDVLKTLKATRDMSVAEVKLVVSIEDPRTKERRMAGMEDERGVSRDEMAEALLEVAEGRVPKDRIALKCLYEEITSWPFLDAPPPKGASGVAAEQGTATPAAAPDASSSATPSSTPSSSAGEASGNDYQALLNADTIAKPYIMGKEARAGDKPQGISDMLPDWVGYLTLYGISAIPVLIVVVTVAILFFSSLK